MIAVKPERIIKIQLVICLKLLKKISRFNGKPVESLSKTVLCQVDFENFELIFEANSDGLGRLKDGLSRLKDGLSRLEMAQNVQN